VLGWPVPFEYADPKLGTKAVDANMLTPIELITATVDGMAQRGFGRVVNITSGRSIEELKEARRATIPAGRYGTLEEFGRICAFICSAQAAYLTGQNILLDGGRIRGRIEAAADFGACRRCHAQPGPSSRRCRRAWSAPRQSNNTGREVA
jgi:NAD(P)-dependent dehydrogenase (short-subunit alcohol dehydrogenase family)